MRTTNYEGDHEKNGTAVNNELSHIQSFTLLLILNVLCFPPIPSNSPLNKILTMNLVIFVNVVHRTHRNYFIFKLSYFICVHVCMHTYM